jgi:hypothetical protein
VESYEALHGANVIKFRGVKIASVSAELPSKDRWTEFSIWCTEHGEIILQGVGRTRVAGEKDKFWSVISKDPIDIIDSIVGNDASRLAKRLLSQAFLHWMAPEDAEPSPV